MELRHILQAVLWCIIVVLSLIPTSAFATPGAKETQAIEHLLNYLRKTSNTILISGKEYTGKEAADFINRRFEEDAPHINTAEEFIDRAGSRNLTTGKRYVYRRPDGSQAELKSWFAAELRRYREDHPF